MGSDSAAQFYKVAIEKYAEMSKYAKPSFVKDKPSLIISTDDALPTVIETLKSGPQSLVMKINPITTLFLLQITFIIKWAYKSVYLYKPMISNFLSPDYYLVATKPKVNFKDAAKRSTMGTPSISRMPSTCPDNTSYGSSGCPASHRSHA